MSRARKKYISLRIVVIVALLSASSVFLAKGQSTKTKWDSYITQGAEAFVEKRYSAAEELLTKAEVEAEKANSTWRIAKTLNTLALLYQVEGRRGEAESVLKRALAISGSSQRPGEEETESMFELAALYQTEGRYAEAEPLLKHWLVIQEIALGLEHPAVALGLHDLAVTEQGEGKFADAEVLIKRALAIRERALGSDDTAVAESLSVLGVVSLDEGKNAEAESSLTRALRIQEKKVAPNDPVVAATLASLAVLYQKQARYVEAEALYQRALAILEKAEEPQLLAENLSNLASLYQTDGKMEQAESLLKRSLAVGEKALGPEHPRVALTMDNLAQLYKAEGRYEEAESLLTRSLAISEKALGPKHPDVAISMDNLAMFYAAERKYSDAESLAKRSLLINEKVLGPDHPDVAVTLDNLAMFYQEQGRYSEAEPLLRRSLTISEKALGPEHPTAVKIMGDLGTLFYAQDNPAQAELFFDRTLQSKVKEFDILFPYLTEKEKLSVLESNFSIFPRFYSFCLVYGKRKPNLVGEMYNAVLWQKRLVGRSIASIRTKIVASNDKEAFDLLQHLTATRSQLAALSFSKPVNLVDWKQSVDQLTQQSNEIEADLVKLSSQFADEKRLERVTWQDLQAALKPGEAAVELVRFNFHDGKRWTDDAYYVALVLTPETKTAPGLVLLGKAIELEGEAFSKYRDLVSGEPISTHTIDSVYESLWQPMEKALKGAKCVYLSPDGLLNLISLPVLPLGDGRRLIDKYDLRIVSSTKDLLRDTKAATNKFAVLIGNPQFDLTESQQSAAVANASHETTDDSPPAEAGKKWLRSHELREGVMLVPLPATKSEIASIRSILEKQGWRVDVFAGESATEEALQRVKGPTILHVATHGFFLPDQSTIIRNAFGWLPAGYEDPMLRSGLFFAGANRTLKGERPPEGLEDGILTASEATGLNLQGTELAVLSACETGLGKVANGEGVFGLRRAMEEAGARAVLMSMWAVPDRETQELMTLFYRKWLSGKNKQQAFREAEMELRAMVKSRYGVDQPFYWGGFVLVGR